MGTVRRGWIFALPLLVVACGEDAEAPKAPAILGFTAEPGEVDPGESSELEWSVEGAGALRIFDGDGAVLLESDEPEAEGTVMTGALRTRTTFTLEVRDAGGNRPARQDLTVQVKIPAPRFTEASATPSAILSGQAVAIRWATENAIAVDVKTSTGASLLEAGPLEGEVIVRPATSRTYVLSARGIETEATEMLTVSVGNRPPTVERLVVTPPSIRVGEASTLSWQVAGAETVRILEVATSSVVVDGGVLRGSRVVSPAQSTDYRLEAIGVGGTETSTVRLTVRALDPVRVVRLDVSPNPAAAGEPVEARWSVSGQPRVAVHLDGQRLLDDGPASGRVLLPLTRPSSLLTLTATGAAGTATAQRRVFLHDPPNVQRFELVPPARETAGPVSVRWAVDPVAQLDLLVEGRPVPGFPAVTATTGPQGASSGNLSVTATRTQVFELEAATAAGALSQSALFVIGVQEAEPNEQSEDSLPPALLGVTRDHLGQAPPGDLDRWSVEVAEGGSIRAETSSGPGRCSIATNLRLFDEGGHLLAEDSDGGRAECSLIDPATHPGAGLLPAGRYFVEVESSSSEAYVLTLGPGTQTCGDGRRDSPESCDDGGRSDGDGCDASCGLETSGPVLSAPGGTVSAGTLTGTVARVFELGLAGPGQSVTATATDPSGLCNVVDTRLRLLDANGRELVDSPNGGPSGAAGDCGAISPWAHPGAANLRAGRYYLAVSGEGSTSGAVELQWSIGMPSCGNGLTETRVGEQCDDGNRTSGDGCSDGCLLEGGAIAEQEPNDTQADATPSGLLGVGRVQLRGEVRPSGDDDVIAFEVPPQQTLILRARTYTTRGQERSCDRNLTDTRVFVEREGREVSAPGQGELDFNDDIDASSGVWCSEVRGLRVSGGPSGQTYYIRIQGWRDLGPASWFLDLELGLR